MDINDQLLVRFLSGEVTDEERAAVEKWCEESIENRRKLEQFYLTEMLVHRVVTHKKIDAANSLNNFKKRIRHLEDQRSHFYLIRKWAAVAAVAASLTGLFFFSDKYITELTEPITLTVQTNRGEKSQFTLPDGSKVWMSACSEVTYKSSLFSKERTVSLVGEAYFEVRKNERKPFVVESKNLKTKVLGTKFNIKALPCDSNITATLEEGAIKLSSGRLKEDIYMKPSEQIVFNTNTGSYIAKKGLSEKQCAQWRNGILLFESASLDEIVNNIKLYHNIEVQFEDASLKSECFTCEFNINDSPIQVFTLLSLTKSIRYKKENSTYKLYRANS